MECELVRRLNDATNNEFKFSLKSACLKRDADFCVFEFYYRDGAILSPAKKQEIQSVMSSIIPQNFRFELKFIKNFISEERARDEFKIFMKKTLPSVSFKLNNVKKENGQFKFFATIDELSFDRAKEVNLPKKLETYFKAKFEEYEYALEMEAGQVFVEDAEKIMKENYHEEEVDMYALRKIEVTESEIYIGEAIEEPASYIKDKSVLGDKAVFCGTIKHINSVIFKSKKKETPNEKSEGKKEDAESLDEMEADAKNQQEENQQSGERKIYKWTLEDFTGTIPCNYFSVKATKAKMEVLENGTTVIVSGKLELNKYSGELTLMVSDISTCKLPEKFEELIVYHKEKPFYEWVKPEKMVIYKQNDLMSFMQEETVCPYLKGKTFVCYDLETTGLHFEAGDKIIEIGAVKIEDGKITEKFVSFVNPERSIPEKASEVNHIYDKDVENAPKDFQVLQDFYKFTRNATLVGQNIIGFDNVFLVGQGKNCRFNFDNDSVDVLDLAHKYVHGVKNYKLGTIAEKLGVQLDNAHRAFYDTLATAEVFIKLAAFIEC